MLWSTEEKQALCELAAEGKLNGPQIADALSRQFNRLFTRSMVSGAVSRLGLRVSAFDPQRAHKIVEKKQPKPKPKPKPLPKQVDEPEKSSLWVLSLALELPETACTIIELTQDRCKFPLWPHALRPQVSFPYCGAAVRTKPYCEKHRKVVYRNDPRDPFVTTKVSVKPEKSTTL